MAATAPFAAPLASVAAADSCDGFAREVLRRGADFGCRFRPRLRGAALFAPRRFVVFRFAMESRRDWRLGLEPPVYFSCEKSSGSMNTDCTCDCSGPFF